MPPKDVREMAVTRVPELEGQLGQIDVGVAQALQCNQDALRMPVTGQRMPSSTSESAAEAKWGTVHRT
jgi:hypothetical protein